jgi:hypothetical protein
LELYTKAVVFELVQGWNQLAMPFCVPEDWTVDDLLVDDEGRPLTNGSIAVWNPATLRYDMTSELPPAGTGFWVFCNESGTSKPQHGTGYPEAGAARRASGWYMLGALACEDGALAISPDTHGCLWDQAEHCYQPLDQAPAPAPGQGCWIYFP